MLHKLSYSPFCHKFRCHGNGVGQYLHIYGYNDATDFNTNKSAPNMATQWYPSYRKHV